MTGRGAVTRAGRGLALHGGWRQAWLWVGGGERRRINRTTGLRLGLACGKVQQSGSSQLGTLSGAGPRVGLTALDERALVG